MARLITIGTFIGMMALFNSGCEMLPEPVVKEKVSNHFILGTVVQTFGNYEVNLKVEGQDRLVVVLLRDGYSQDEVESWRDSNQSFSGNLVENWLTEAELEN